LNSSSSLKRDRLIRSVVKGAGVTVIGMIMSRLFGYGIRVLLARTLAPEGYGQIGIANSFLAIIGMITLLGIPTALTRQIALYRIHKDKKAENETIRSGLWLSLPLTLLFVIIILFFSKWLAVNVFHDEGLTPVFRLFAFIIPLFSIDQLFGAILLGYQRVKAYTSIHDFFRFGLTLCFLFLFFKIFQPTSILAAWAYFYGFLGAAFVYVLVTRKHLTGIFRLPNLRSETTRQLLHFSWPLVMSSLLWILIPRTDILMLGYFTTVHLVGIYNSAVPMAEFISLFSRAFVPIFIPIFTGLISQDRNREIKELYKLITRWILIASIPMIWIIFIGAKQVIVFVFGSQYIEAIVPLQILACAYFVPLLVGPTSSFITTLGKTKIILYDTVFIYLLSVSLNLLLIPKYGLNGAAIATTVSFICHRVLTLIQIHKYSQLHPFNIRYFKLFITGILSSAFFYVFLHQYSKGVDDVVKFVLTFGITLILYGFLLLLFQVFDDDDVMIFRSIWIRITKSK